MLIFSNPSWTLYFLFTFSLQISKYCSCKARPEIHCIPLVAVMGGKYVTTGISFGFCAIFKVQQWLEKEESEAHCLFTVEILQDQWKGWYRWAYFLISSFSLPFFFFIIYKSLCVLTLKNSFFPQGTLKNPTFTFPSTISVPLASYYKLELMGL